MSVRKEIKTSITTLTRVRSSRNGNPRFELRFVGGAYYTAPDTMVAYTAEQDFGAASEENPIETTLIVDGRQNVIGWLL